MVKYGIPMMASSGYVATVDETLCSACGACADFCAFGAIILDEQSVIDWEKCVGCGVCVDQCPNDALTLTRDEKKGIPLEMKVLVK